MTDEAVQSVGLESRFGAFGRHHTVDVKYAPQREGATMKLTMKQNHVRLSTTVNFDKLRSSKLKEHSEQYEMVAPLRALGTVKVWFDARSNAARFTLFRRLDYRNHFDAEYVYDRRGKRAVTLGMSHLYSPRHSFNLKANYGEKKYSVEWLCKTGNGPWSVKTDFSFDKRYVFMS